MSNNYLQFLSGLKTVTVPNDDVLNFGTDDFSIAFRFKAIAGANASEVITKVATKGYIISYINSTGILQLELRDGTSPTTTISSNTITDDVWYSVIFNVDRDGVGVCYLDAVAGTPSTTMANAIDTITNTSIFLIGTFGGNFCMDDIRIYKSALTLQERNEIFFNGIGKKYAALSTGKVASWASDCDDGTGLTLTDAVGAVDGTLNSDTLWATGGTPFVPTGVNYYILKRDTTIIAYISDPLPSTFSVVDDFSALDDGDYDYTLTPVSAYGVTGTATEPLTITLVSGVPQTYPSGLPTNVYLTAQSAGRVKLNWKFTPTDYTPDMFTISYSTDITTIEADPEAEPPVEYSQTVNSWTGTEGEVYAGSQYSHTTVVSWNTDDLVAFKIEPTLGDFTTSTTTYYTVIADATAPVIVNPDTKIDITVV